MKPSQISQSLIRLATAVDFARSPSRSLVAAQLSNMILALNMDIKTVRSDMEGALSRMDLGKLPKKTKLNIPTLKDVERELGINVYVGLRGGDFMATVDGEPAYEVSVGDFSPRDAAQALAGALMGAIGNKAFN